MDKIIAEANAYFGQFKDCADRIDRAMPLIQDVYLVHVPGYTGFGVDEIVRKYPEYSSEYNNILTRVEAWMLKFS